MSPSTSSTKTQIGWGALIAVLAFAATSAAAEGWKPAPGNLLTAWAAKVDPQCPLPEYPRPQMVRAEWQNLNGLWDYAIQPDPAAYVGGYAGKILVPYPIESALSGVKKPLTAKERLWYRRSFTAPRSKENACSCTSGPSIGKCAWR